MVPRESQAPQLNSGKYSPSLKTMHQETRSGLYTLHVAVSLIVLLTLIVLSRNSGLLGALVICASAVLLFGVIFTPDVFLFLVPLVFVIAGMPTFDPGRIFQVVRWIFLLLLGVSLTVRGGIASLGRAWNPVYLSLALFMALCVMSIDHSPNGMMTLLKSVAFGALLLVAVTNGALLRNCNGAGTRLCSYFALAAGVVVVTCVAAARGGLSGPGGNFEGPFGNANFLGAFLGLTAPFLLFRANRAVQPNPIKRFGAWALLLGAVLFLIASHCRAGIGAACLASGWWVFFSRRRVTAMVLFVGALSLLAVSAYLPSDVSWFKNEYILKNGTSVLGSREGVWHRSMDAVKRNPLLGGGFGTNQSMSRDWRLSFQTGKWSLETGSSYLGVAGQVGLVGALLLFVPIGWVLSRTGQWLSACRRKSEMTPEFWSTLALSSCVVGGLTDAFAEGWMTAPGSFQAVIFWIAFGVLAARVSRPLYWNRPRLADSRRT